MHEAALAESILEIAQETAAASHAERISAIGLKIGDMAGVDTDALNFSFDVLKKNTAASAAELKISRVPIRAECNKCGRIFTVERYNFFCPECDGILILRSGRELLVEFVDCE